MARRSHRIDMGGVSVTKSGTPPAVEDLYYATMEMGWPAFIGLVALAFLLINLGFGLLYAAMPGAIAAMPAGSLVDGFFFSADTLATVGYGAMAPATHLGHAVATVEMLTGLFFSATITGLIFARFARPRNGFVFSRVAVIAQLEGRPTLMVRLASTRRRPLATVTAYMAWLERVSLADGRTFRRLVELPLARARNPIMGLSWTLAHTIEEGSPMLSALEDGGEFRLLVTVTALDTLLSSQATGARNYGRDEILRDHDYDDAITEEDGTFHLDLTRLDAVRPLVA